MNSENKRFLDSPGAAFFFGWPLLVVSWQSRLRPIFYIF